VIKMPNWKFRRIPTGRLELVEVISEEELLEIPTCQLGDKCPKGKLPCCAHCDEPCEDKCEFLEENDDPTNCPFYSNPWKIRYLFS